MQKSKEKIQLKNFLSQKVSQIQKTQFKIAELFSLNSLVSVLTGECR